MKSLVKFIVKSIQMQTALILALKAHTPGVVGAFTDVVLDLVPVAGEFREKLLANPQFRQALGEYIQATQSPEGMEEVDARLRVAMGLLKAAAFGRQYEEEQEEGPQMDA